MSSPFRENPAVVSCPKCGSLRCDCGKDSVLAECNYLLPPTCSCPRCNTEFHGMQRMVFVHSEDMWAEKNRALIKRIDKSLDLLTHCKRWRIVELVEKYIVAEDFWIWSRAHVHIDDDKTEGPEKPLYSSLLMVRWKVCNPPASMKHIIACIERDRDDVERLHRWRHPFDPRAYDKMYCPDCGAEMTKLFIVGGWRCECFPTEEEMAGR